MARLLSISLLLLAVAGCGGSDSVAKKNSSTTTTTDPEVIEDNGDSKVTDPPVKPAPKPDPTPAQTFVPAEDNEITALKDVPVADLIEKLSDAKQRDLAARAIVARGAEAVDPLVKALDADDAQVRAAAAFALGQLGKDAASAKDRLKKMAQDDRDEIARDAATFALDALETPAKSEK
jgi:hypothetical protein